MKTILSTLVCAFTFTGCVSTTSIGTGSDRKQFMVVSQEYALKKSEEQTKKLTGGEAEKSYYQHYEKRLVSIMNRLIPYADEYNNNEKINWNIHLWHTDKLNAGALGNGMILISKKIYNNRSLTDDELAFIIAHEMAHVVRNHYRETLSWKYTVKPALIASSVLTSGVASAVSILGHDAYASGFNRTMEFEADKLGMEIYAKAGFNPHNAVSVLEKFKPMFEKEHPIASKLPSFMSTHPSLNKRIKEVSEDMNSMVELYQKHQPKQSDNLIDFDFNAQAERLGLNKLPKPVIIFVDKTANQNVQTFDVNIANDDDSQVVQSFVKLERNKSEL